MSSKYIHPGQSKALFKILYWIGKYLYKFRFEIITESQKPLEETSGPLLILCKHSSNHDIPGGIPSMVDHIGRPAWCIIKDSLTSPYFFGFFLKIGGIPVDRKNPEKSKEQLLYARKTLQEGNALVIFPEQSRYKGKMGRGKASGFRFVTGKPSEPINVLCVGMEYSKNIFRRKLTVRFGEVRKYSKSDNPEIFLHDCMLEIAKLSNLEYRFPGPEIKRET